MKIRLILALCSAIVLVAACAPTPQIRNDAYLVDDSFLTGDPCEAPCWRGITPGETDWEDAVAIIQDDTTLNDFQQEVAEDTDAIGAVWGRVDGERCCQMFTEEGDVVEFIVLQTAPNSTLGEALDVHGDPDYLFGQALTDDQGVFSLFYVDIPMLLYVFVEGEAGVLSATSEIVGFGYTTEDNMQRLVNESELHTWEGYQSFTDYMEGELEITPIPTAEADAEDTNSADSEETETSSENEDGS